jgi:RHS repeat-associated protein
MDRGANQNRAHNVSNEVSSLPSWMSPTYDDAGNMTRIPRPDAPSTLKWDLVWDAWNRLVTASDGATSHTYKYDGLNQRIQKSTGGVIYDYYHNTQWQVLEVRKDGSANPYEQNFWHPYYIDALAIRRYDGGTSGSQTRYHYAHDANFNVTAVFGLDGTVAERYDYSPYGVVSVLNGSFTAIGATAIANTTTYTGRSLDTETGLYYYRNRYYHAQLGRFLSRDPIGYLAKSQNVYGYVHSRPVIGMDPLGLVDEWAFDIDDDGNPIEEDPVIGGVGPIENYTVVWHKWRSAFLYTSVDQWKRGERLVQGTCKKGGELKAHSIEISHAVGRNAEVSGSVLATLGVTSLDGAIAELGISVDVSAGVDDVSTEISRLPGGDLACGCGENLDFWYWQRYNTYNFFFYQQPMWDPTGFDISDIPSTDWTYIGAIRIPTNDFREFHRCVPIPACSQAGIDTTLDDPSPIDEDDNPFGNNGNGNGRFRF